MTSEERRTRRASPGRPTRAQYAVESLRVTATARVIEVGCGAGQALAALRTKHPTIELTGIDRSATQIAKARRLLSDLPPGIRPRLARLTLAAAARRWHDTPFDWLLAINVNAFWTEPGDAFVAASRLLRRRGKALLVYEPPTAAGLDILTTKLHRAIVASGWRMIDERRRERCVILTVQPNVASESPATIADNSLQ